MRLRNRLIKASFWTDPELLQWPREKRWFYEGLWHIAEDSGCLEDSPFAFKLELFPSPVDADITVEVLAKWRDELIEAGKLTPYNAAGKRYLFLRNFHRHQEIRNPRRPECPLPSWIEWVSNEQDSRKGKYVVQEPLEAHTTVSQSSDDGCTTVVQPLINASTRVKGPLYKPQRNGTERKVTERKGRGARKLSLAHPPSADADSPPPTAPPASPSEQQLLSILQGVAGYPFDKNKDLQFIRQLAEDFPDTDILAEAKAWRTYKLDRPLEKKSNARSQFRNWVSKSKQFKRVRDAPDRDDDDQSRNPIYRDLTEEAMREAKELGWILEENNEL